MRNQRFSKGICWRNKELSFGSTLVSNLSASFQLFLADVPGVGISRFSTWLSFSLANEFVRWFQMVQLRTLRISEWYGQDWFCYCFVFGSISAVRWVCAGRAHSLEPPFHLPASGFRSSLSPASAFPLLFHPSRTYSSYFVYGNLIIY